MLTERKRERKKREGEREWGIIRVKDERSEQEVKKEEDERSEQEVKKEEDEEK